MHALDIADALQAIRVGTGKPQFDSRHLRAQQRQHFASEYCSGLPVGEVTVVPQKQGALWGSVRRNGAARNVDHRVAGGDWQPKLGAEQLGVLGGDRLEQRRLWVIAMHVTPPKPRIAAVGNGP